MAWLACVDAHTLHTLLAFPHHLPHTRRHTRLPPMHMHMGAPYHHPSRTSRHAHTIIITRPMGARPTVLQLGNSLRNLVPPSPLSWLRGNHPLSIHIERKSRLTAWSQCGPPNNRPNYHQPSVISTSFPSVPSPPPPALAPLWQRAAA